MSETAANVYVERVEKATTLREYAMILGSNYEQYIDYALGPAIRGCGLVFGARDPLLGPIGLTWGTSSLDPSVLYVPYIFISPDARGTGAFELLESALQHGATAANFSEGFGLVAATNLRSKAALSKTGWHEIGSRKDFYFQGGETCLFFKCYCDQSRLRPDEGSVFWRGVLNPS